ncbi:MAG: ClpP/crotonase-like domain-containing protein, partial [Olpidium bornovanus]
SRYGRFWWIRLGDNFTFPVLAHPSKKNKRINDVFISLPDVHVLSTGEAGKRYALPNSSIMMHQPSGGASGQASDIAIIAREILRVRERLNRIYQKHCRPQGKEHSLDTIGACWSSGRVPGGRPLKFVGRSLSAETTVERDYFMTSQEALEFGLIDHVLEKRLPTSVSATKT